MNGIFKKTLLISLFFLTTHSYGLLKININQQNAQTMQIALAQFSGINTPINNIADIINNNFINSGRFSIKRMPAIKDSIDFPSLKQQKVEAIVYGDVKKLSNNKFVVSIYVYDAWTKASLFTKKITTNNISRRIVHLISDKVYFALLGEQGFFDTSIAYISLEKNKKLKYRLEVVDSDGLNAQLVFASKEPIMSPSWSPDNKQLAYVSFSSGRSRVYIQHLLVNNKPLVLPNFDGISSSPSWHPNGKSLIFTLSKNGNQDLYQYFLNGKLKRITEHHGIDTEGNFSPDGNTIVWTSNRDGSVQIYHKNLRTGKIYKLDILGDYNANPSFSPDGKNIILVHKELNAYTIAKFEVTSKDFVVLTNNSIDESPDFAPNGKMVIFSNTKNNASALSAVATDGTYSIDLSDGSKEIREPAWSGFL